MVSTALQVAGQAGELGCVWKDARVGLPLAGLRACARARVPCGPRARASHGGAQARAAFERERRADRSGRCTACCAATAPPLLAPLASLTRATCALARASARSPEQSSLLRARITAFLAGFGVAGGGAMYQLRKDVWSSHEMIDARVKANGKDVDDKVQAMQKEIEQGQS